MQVTKAEHHRVVRDALTKLNSATAKVGGGRDEQLDALKQRITWTTYESVLLSMPLLCFIVTPQRFDTTYRSKQPYTQNGRPSQAQVSYSPELSSVLIYVPPMLSEDSALQAHQFAALPLQGEIVHQCVVKLPLETIVRDCSNPVAVDKFKRLVEELADEYPAQDMEICGGRISSLKRSFLPEKWGKRSSLLIVMTATEHLHLMSADCLSLRVNAHTLHLQLTGNGGLSQ